MWATVKSRRVGVWPADFAPMLLVTVEGAGRKVSKLARTEGEGAARALLDLEALKTISGNQSGSRRG